MLQPNWLIIRPSADARVQLPIEPIVPRPVDAPSSDHRGTESIQKAAGRRVGSPTSQSFQAAAAAPPWRIGDKDVSFQRYGWNDLHGGYRSAWLIHGFLRDHVCFYDEMALKHRLDLEMLIPLSRQQFAIGFA